MSRKVCLFSPRSGGGFLLSGKNEGGKERREEGEGKGGRGRKELALREEGSEGTKEGRGRGKGKSRGREEGKEEGKGKQGREGRNEGAGAATTLPARPDQSSRKKSPYDISYSSRFSIFCRVDS